jgi:hypothetical protein
MPVHIVTKVKALFQVASSNPVPRLPEQSINYIDDQTI